MGFLQTISQSETDVYSMSGNFKFKLFLEMFNFSRKFLQAVVEHNQKILNSLSLPDSERNTIIFFKRRLLQHHKVRNKIESKNIMTPACCHITMRFVKLVSKIALNFVLQSICLSLILNRCFVIIIIQFRKHSR